MFQNNIRGGSVNYSSEEQVIGEWFGETLYQKTVNCGALPSATAKSVAHGISNINRVLDYKGISTDGESYATLPFVNPMQQNGINHGVMVMVDKTNITITNRLDYSSFTSTYITIQYTKTT